MDKVSNFVVVAKREGRWWVQVVLPPPPLYPEECRGRLSATGVMVHLTLFLIYAWMAVVLQLWVKVQLW